MSEMNLPFTCENDGSLLDLDATELIIPLSLVRNTYTSDTC